jgi:hypothetical protein
MSDITHYKDVWMCVRACVRTCAIVSDCHPTPLAFAFMVERHLEIKIEIARSNETEKKRERQL